jgi:hypothetical protein
MKWRVNFFDKNSSEIRSITVTVDADNEEQAESKACRIVDNLGWANNFKLADEEELEV